MSRLRSLVRNLVQRNRMQRELDDELRAMFDLLVAERIARGMQPWEAKRAASIEMGGIEPLKERVRDVKMGVHLNTLFSDIKHAFRHFRRSPGFAVAAILTLALGIGANTAMFSVLNTLALQRLSIPEPDHLYSLSSYNDRGVKRYIPMPTVIDLNRQSPFVEACGYNGGGIFPVEANRIPGQAIAAFVTGRCFNVFGVQPVLGRAIGDDDAPIMTSGAKVIVISDRLWRRHFNRDPNVIGQVMKVDAAAAVVIGVMPPGFRGIHVDSGIDIFAPPDSISPATQGRRPVAQEVLGRLKPGITYKQASAQFDAMWPALLKEALAANRGAQEGAGILGQIVRLDPMGHGLSQTREQYAQSVRIILGLTGLLLLLACVNLGGLLLARLNARAVELGVRLAIGGSRLRIAQQMLVEGLLLSGFGALLAVPTAYLFVAPIPALIDPGFAGWELTFSPDSRVVMATAVAGFVVGILLTAIPMWFALRRRDSVTFSWDRTMTGKASRWTRGLVVAQVVLSVVLIIGAALLTRSLQAIQSADPGVRTENFMTARLMSAPGGNRGLVASAHYPPLVEKLQAIPGVRQVAYSQVFPRRLRLLGSDVGFVGQEFTGVRTSLDSVSSNFFDAMGIRLVKGRLFTDADTRQSQRVVILSEALARQLAPEGNILDRHLKFQTNREMQDLTVVGVVANSTQGDLKLTDANVMFSPAYQAAAFSGPNLLLEISGDPTPIADAVRRTVLEHGREFVSDISMVDDLLARGPARERMSALLSALIGVLGVLLAVIGIHGVLAYSVSRRTREIGVRVAVGADPARVATSVVREGLMLTVIGIAVGLPLAYVSARALRGLLFGISETDYVSFAVAAVLFSIVGAVAGVLPARRAARIDPAITLRAD